MVMTSPAVCDLTTFRVTPILLAESGRLTFKMMSWLSCLRSRVCCERKKKKREKGKDRRSITPK